MFEAYSVGIRISLINGVAGGLLALSRQFGKVDGQVKDLQVRLDRLGRTLAAGGAFAAAGGGILAMVGKTLPAAKAYTHELAQMNIAGMKQVEITKSIKAAWDATASVPTSKVAENLSAIRELRSVVGSTGEAVSILPTVLKLQAVLSNVKGVKDAKGTAYDVAKLLDIRGASMDPARFRNESDMMLKAIVMSGGTLDAKDFFSTGKYGRLATQSWSPEFLYQILPTLMQEMKSGGGSGGAGGPGNALMSAYSAVVGGTITQKSLAIWDRLGLLDPSKVVWTKSGAAKGVLPGGIKGTELFQENPYAWSQQILMPALRAAGINSPKEQQQYLQMLFANRTAGFAMSQLALQPTKFQRDQQMIRGAQGMEAYQTLLKTDPIMAEAAMAAQWNNIKTRLGIQILPDLLDVLQKLIPYLVNFTKWLGENEKSVRLFMRGATALGAVLAAIGALLTAKAVVGAFGLLLRVLGGGVGVLRSATGLFSGILTPIAKMASLSTGGLLATLGALASFLGLAAGLGSRMKSDADRVKAHDPGYNFWTAPFTNTGQPGRGSPFVPAGGGKTQMSGDVNLDGRKVGDVLWRQGSRLDGLPDTNRAGFDPGMGPGYGRVQGWN